MKLLAWWTFLGWYFAVIIDSHPLLKSSLPTITLADLLSIVVSSKGMFR